MKSAIQTVQESLYHVQNQMLDCVTPEGYVRTHLRYKYLELMKEEARLKDSLAFLSNSRRQTKKV